MNTETIKAFRDSADENITKLTSTELTQLKGGRVTSLEEHCATTWTIVTNNGIAADSELGLIAIANCGSTWWPDGDSPDNPYQ